MNSTKIFERNTSDAKDGGFIFQAKISHNLSFEIQEGNVVLGAGTSFPFDKTNINAKLHQVDLFPDLKTTEGTATLTYVILSEVNTLARKFELAAEVVKRQIINPYIEVEQEPIQPVEVPQQAEPIQPPGGEQRALPPVTEAENSIKTKVRIYYRDEVKRLEEKGALTRNESKRLNLQFFKGTSYKVTLSTNNIFLREVSSSSLDSGSPEITLKISTSLVDEAFGSKVPSFEAFKLVVSGSMSAKVEGAQVANFEIFDPIEKKDDKIFQTIIPSLILMFKSDQVPVETFRNKSSEIAARSGTDYNNLFNFDKLSSEEEEEIGIEDIIADEEPQEGEAGPQQQENKKKNIELQIEKLSNAISTAEKELAAAADDQKKKEAQYRLDELKKKLEGAKKAYSSLGESLYVEQQLILLEKELSSFYQQFNMLLENRGGTKRFY